jgi:hypothetical protein
VSARARGIPWAARSDPDEPGVHRGDVLVLDGGGYALLHADEGDGWLSEEDIVDHAAQGEVRRGPLHEVPGTTFSVLHPRTFIDLRRQLQSAGYGSLGLSLFYGPGLQRACREFQSEHGLPPTGIPDDTTRAAVAEFLDRLQSPDDTGSSDGP